MTLSRGLVLLVLALATGSAFAQPKPALVQDRDEPARDPFQQLVANNACFGEPTCEVSFAPVPAGKRLILTQVSIETSVVDADLPLYFRVSNGLSARAAFTLTNSSTPRIATFPLVLFMNAGDTPSVVAFASPTRFGGSFVVALVGYYLTL